MTDWLDDPLGILGRPLDGRRLIVFTGMSGSGKSTYIDLLLDRHPDLAHRAVTWVGPAPIAWPIAPPRTDLVVVDEVARVGEIARLARLLGRGHTLIVASHLPSALTRGLGLGWPSAFFRTDASSESLERWLRAHGIAFTQPSLRDFVRAYGTNYTDLAIVLEHGGGVDFDHAFRRFVSCASISRRRV